MLRPVRPAPFGAYRVDGLRFAGHGFGVECTGGTVRVLDLPDDIEVVIEYADDPRPVPRQ